MSSKLQNTKDFYNLLSPVYLSPNVNIAESNFAVSGGSWGSRCKSKLTEDTLLDSDYEDKGPSLRKPLRKQFFKIEDIPNGLLEGGGTPRFLRKK